MKFGRILNKFTGGTEKVFKLIDQSFLTPEYKEQYKKIWKEKLKKLI